MFHAASVGVAPTNFTLVTNHSQLMSVQSVLQGVDLLALDTETTGLKPFHTSRMRLLSLCVDGENPWVIDCDQVDPSSLIQSLRRKVIVAHNWAFDAPFLIQYGFDFAANSLRDTFIGSFLLNCGFGVSNSLGSVLYDRMGIEVDKVLQKSDWSGELSLAQLEYAAKDTAVLLDLHRILYREIAKNNLRTIWRLEHKVLKATIWMRLNGVNVDKNKWISLYNAAVKRRTRLNSELQEMVPPRTFINTPWNWRKHWDIKAAASRIGLTLKSTSKDELCMHTDNDFVSKIMEWRKADQIIKTFGPEWLEHIGADAKVHAEFMQCRPETGRFSCNSPNLQQIPRGSHRKAFVAPVGFSIVKADYSAIELRMIAWVAKETNMQEAFRNGVDLHTKTAKDVLGKDRPTKEDRTLAKALNFGLIYGCGAKTLRTTLAKNWGILLPLEDLQEMRKQFFQTYPGLKRYHAKMKQPGKLIFRTKWGRTRGGMGPKLKRDRWGNWKWQEQFTKKCNTPIQSNSADGMKKALSEVWSKRNDWPEMTMLMPVHDEIVLMCPTVQADSVAEWLKTIMVNAMQPLLGTVPCEVEAGVGKSWGG